MAFFGLLPDPPTPPNPYATAAAQTGTNVSTAVANAYLGNVNQVTPQGSLTFSPTGSYQWKDPTTNQTYTIPTFTQTQTLTPTGQQLQNTTDQTKQVLANTGYQQASRISGLLGSPFNPQLDPQAYLQANPDVAAYARSNGLDPVQFAQQHYQYYGINEGRSGMSPQGGDASGIYGVNPAQTDFFNTSQYLQQNPDVREAMTQWSRDLGVSVDEAARLHYQYYGQQEGRALNNTGDVQRTFGDAGDVTRSYGPADDFSSDRQRVEDSLMARMNPQLSRERENIEQRLADQGIRYGSPAYQDAMDDYNRQATDTRFGAISQAGQEQQRMMDMAAQRAGFQNSAQQQAYEQAMGRSTFYNQAQNQAFGQNAQQANFYNAGLAQQLAQQQAGFNASNAQRNQYMQEAYQQRNQPMNEISALSSGSQLQQPNWLNSPSSQIPTTDFAGIMNQNFQNQMGIYNQQSTSANNIIGGVLGMGASALKPSDERVKTNIDRIGTIFSANEDGEREKLPIYEYEYKEGHGTMGRHLGPMAQDVEKQDPKAVKTVRGVKHIDTKRVMGNILRAA